MDKQLPHFIIVGTMKSGTSTLMHHLRNHPYIHTPAQEVHFFNNEVNYSKGPEWYYKVLQEELPKKALIIGEKTPTYAYQENVAERIFKLAPKTKLIWVFRNPVDRAYSNYQHVLKRGDEFLSFEDAIKQEKDRISKDIFKGYKKRSLYHEQVSRFLEYFPKEQMFFMLFEDLKKPYDNSHVLNDLFKFIEAPIAEFNFSEEPKNETINTPTNPKLYYHAKRSNLYKFKLFRKIIYKLSFSKNILKYDKMDLATRTYLVDYFKPHNEMLSSIIQKDLSGWNR